MISHPAQLNNIINNLHVQEPIQAQLDEEVQFQNVRFSCYAGLATLAYNRSLQVLHPPRNTTSQTGQLLRTRGEILKQLGKFIEPILPAPACFLARFDFTGMEEFCSQRADPVMRALKGIYPVIDTSSVPALQFLPYFDYLDGTNNDLLVGNPNWQLSRKVHTQFYQKRIKPLCSSFQQCSDEYLIGLRLSYIMILHREDEMNDYFKFILDRFHQLHNKESEGDHMQENEEEGAKRQKRQEQESLVNRLKLWIDNYFAFMKQGLELYRGGNDMEIVSTVLCRRDQIHSSLRGLDISLMKCIDGNEMETDYFEILESIESEIPLSGQKQTKSLQLFLLSIVHCSIKAKGRQNEKIDKKVRQIYKKLMRSFQPYLEPFLRVFYDNQQICQFYEQSELRPVPTMYDFGPQLMQKIATICINNNEAAHITNVNTLFHLDQLIQMEKLTQSKLMGTSRGVDIFNILSSRKELYLKALQSLRDRNCASRFQNYLDKWEKYYSCFSGSFSVKSVLYMLEGFNGLNDRKNITQGINLQGPCQKIESASKIVVQILEKFTKANKRYETLQSDGQINGEELESHGVREVIDGYINLLFNRSFLLLLSGLEKQRQADHVKLVEDLWREWAQYKLCCGQFDRQLHIPSKREGGKKKGVGEDEFEELRSVGGSRNIIL